MIETRIEKEADATYVEVKSGRLALVLCSVGASVWKVLWDGALINLAPSRDVFVEDDQFNGKTLARVAGRIPAEASFEGKKLHLKEEKQGYCLHGGKMTSLSFKNFACRIENKPGKTRVVYDADDPDASNGFPGNLHLTVAYEFEEGKDGFVIRYEGQSDADTLFSPSNHLYWDLSQTQDISEDVLQVKASRCGTNDGKSQLVTGVEKVPPFFDFTSPSLLGPKLKEIDEKVWEKTIDHLFPFDEVGSNDPQVVYRNASVALSLFTDFQAVNMYADDSMSDYPFENAQGERILKRYRALALEPQDISLGLEKIVLKAGEKRERFIEYRFSDPV